MSKNNSKFSILAHLLIFVAGIAFVYASQSRNLNNPATSDLYLNLGATFMATTVLSFLYQLLGIQDLAEQLKNIQVDTGNKLKNVLDSSLLYGKFLEGGITDFWVERRHINPSTWNTFTQSASNEVWLFGIAEHGYAVDSRFIDIVASGVNRGCNYKILLLDAQSPLVRDWDEKNQTNEPSRSQISVIDATKRFQAMIEKNHGKKGKIELRVYDDIPSMSIVRSDSEMLVTLFIRSLQRDNSPTLKVQEIPNGLYSHYLEHFNNFWSSAKVIATTR